MVGEWYTRAWLLRRWPAVGYNVGAWLHSFGIAASHMTAGPYHTAAVTRLSNTVELKQLGCFEDVVAREIDAAAAAAGVVAVNGPLA